MAVATMVLLYMPRSEEVDSPLLQARRLGSGCIDWFGGCSFRQTTCGSCWSWLARPCCFMAACSASQAFLQELCLWT